MMKRIIYATALMVLFAPNVMAKRAAPKEVPPIVTEKAIFSVPHFRALGSAQNRELREALENRERILREVHENGGRLPEAHEKLEPIKAPQNGGVVEARDPKTKTLLWQVQVYKTDYDNGLEKDIQDVFITSLTLDKVHNLLIMSDEKSRVFVLNLSTKKVTQIE